MKLENNQKITVNLPGQKPTERLVPITLVERVKMFKARGGFVRFVTGEPGELDHFIQETLHAAGVRDANQCENCDGTGRVGIEWFVAGPHEAPKNKTDMSGGTRGGSYVKRTYGVVPMRRRGAVGFDYYNHDTKFFKCPVCREGEIL